MFSHKKGMKRRKFSLLVWILLGVFLLVGLFGGYVFYSVYFKGDDGNGGARVLKNPTEGLSDEEAILNFDESFVLYLLYSIGAYKLHNPPFSDNTPKIELYIGEKIFGAEVDNGKIFVDPGAIDGEDIVIISPASEAVKMLREKGYIAESFREGKSSVEIVAGKTSLFSKGYLDIYKELGGGEIE